MAPIVSCAPNCYSILVSQYVSPGATPHPTQMGPFAPPTFLQDCGKPAGPQGIKRKSGGGSNVELEGGDPLKDPQGGQGE